MIRHNPSSTGSNKLIYFLSNDNSVRSRDREYYGKERGGSFMNAKLVSLGWLPIAPYTFARWED